MEKRRGGIGNRAEYGDPEPGIRGAGMRDLEQRVEGAPFFELTEAQRGLKLNAWIFILCALQRGIGQRFYAIEIRFGQAQRLLTNARITIFESRENEWRVQARERPQEP